MPYIDQERRAVLNDRIDNLTESLTSHGDLNYAITRIIRSLAAVEGHSYSTLVPYIGDLDCVKQELFQRVINPYEDTKREQNGDIFADVANIRLTA